MCTCADTLHSLALAWRRSVDEGMQLHLRLSRPVIAAVVWHPTIKSARWRRPVVASLARGPLLSQQSPAAVPRNCVMSESRRLWKHPPICNQQNILEFLKMREENLNILAFDILFLSEMSLNAPWSARAPHPHHRTSGLRAAAPFQIALYDGHADRPTE